MSKHLGLFIITLMFLGCNPKAKINHEEDARRLNNRATELIEVNPDSALLLLDAAIKLDSNMHITYFNKMTVYCNKGEYFKAIEVTNQGLQKKPDFAEGRTFLGMLYDKTGQHNKANGEYLKAFQTYSDRLQKGDNKNPANELNQAVTLLLLGKEEGKKKIEQLIAKNPSDESLQSFKNFDKSAYIDSIFKK